MTPPAPQQVAALAKKYVEVVRSGMGYENFLAELEQLVTTAHATGYAAGLKAAEQACNDLAKSWEPERPWTTHLEGKIFGANDCADAIATLREAPL